MISDVLESFTLGKFSIAGMVYIRLSNVCSLKLS